MAIYTRFGSKVTVLAVLQDNQHTWLKVQFEDGAIREYASYEFRADNGYAEIQSAMDALGVTKIEYNAENEQIAAPVVETPAQEAVDGFERPCERCSGSGDVITAGLYIVPCPECYGTGIHTEPEPTELDTLRAEVATLKQQLAAARANLAITQKALEAIASNYVGDRTPASIAGDALIQSNYYVDALTAETSPMEDARS